MIADAADEISIEPLQLHKKTRSDVLARIADWAAQRAERVFVRPAGYRGRGPLPDIERRSGRIDDVLQSRRHEPETYVVEHELR